MVCECLRSSVESLAYTCVLCCDFAKHYIFLAQMLPTRVKKNASDLLDHANTVHHSFTYLDSMPWWGSPEVKYFFWCCGIGIEHYWGWCCTCFQCGDGCFVFLRILDSEGPGHRSEQFAFQISHWVCTLCLHHLGPVQAPLPDGAEGPHDCAHSAWSLGSIPNGWLGWTSNCFHQSIPRRLHWETCKDLTTGEYSIHAPVSFV